MGCTSGKEKVSLSNFGSSMTKLEKLVETQVTSSPVINPTPPDERSAKSQAISDEVVKGTYDGSNDNQPFNVINEAVTMKRTRTSLALVAGKVLVAKDTNIAVLNESEGGEVLSVNQ